MRNDIGYLPVRPLTQLNLATMKLLLIEDEVTLAEAVLEYLQGEGYRCEWAGTFDAAQEKFISTRMIVCWSILPYPMAMDWCSSKPLKKATPKRG